jgi:hypothetical protein
MANVSYPNVQSKAEKPLNTTTRGSGSSSRVCAHSEQMAAFGAQPATDWTTPLGAKQPMLSKKSMSGFHQVQRPREAGKLPLHSTQSGHANLRPQLECWSIALNIGRVRQRGGNCGVVGWPWIMRLRWKSGWARRQSGAVLVRPSPRSACSGVGAATHHLLPATRHRSSV